MRRRAGSGCEECTVLKFPSPICPTWWPVDFPLAMPGGTVYGGDFAGLGEAGCPSVRHEVRITPAAAGNGDAGLIKKAWAQVELDNAPATFGGDPLIELTLADWAALGSPSPGVAATLNTWLRSYTCDDFSHKEDFCQNGVTMPALYEMEEASGNRLSTYTPSGGPGGSLVPQGVVTTVPGRIGTLAVFTAGDVNGNSLVGSGIPFSVIGNYAFAFWHKPSSANPFNGFGSPLWVGGDGTAAATNMFRILWSQDAAWQDNINLQVSTGAAWTSHQIAPRPADDVWYAVLGRMGPGYSDFWVVSDDGSLDVSATGSSTPIIPGGGWGVNGFSGGAARVGGATDQVYLWSGFAPSKEQMLAKLGWVAP